MWIVRLALRRPYTFVVAAILVFILGVTTIFRMPTDIFPDIEIPVISVIYSYTGMSADDMEKRIITPYERVLTTVVNDVEHTESQSLNGIGIVKIFLQPGASIEGATAQVTAVAQTALRSMPTGTQPPLIIRYSASNVPILQLSISSDTLPEQTMFDLAINSVRQQLITIPGIQIPYPYGGRQRQVVVDLDPDRMYALGVSPADVSTAVNAQNLILPAGSVKIGTQEFQVRLNASPDSVGELNDLPIRTDTNPDGSKTTIYVRDIASVRDGFQVQTNVANANGKRGVLITILKNGDASTLAIVDAVKARLPAIKAALPSGGEELQITPLFDQSVFVRASVKGVITEGAIAAGLTALMILLFLGSWRSTIIVLVSIPLSLLVSILFLAALGYTLNTMTLGGMALAVGILVDDATVEIENIHRNLHQRKRLVQAILDGASQIAIPAFVSTLCICIVFVPVVFIAGAAKYLFTPLALAVVFAMLTSYLLSRTIVPTLVHYLLASEVEMYGGKIDPDDPRENKDHEHHKQRLRPGTRWWVKLIALVVVAVIVATLGVSLTPLGKLAPKLHDISKAIVVFPIRHAAMMLALVGLIVAAGCVIRYQLIWRAHYAFDRQFERMRQFYGRILAWSLIHRTSTIAGFTTAALFSIIVLWPLTGRDFFPSVDAGQIRLHVRAPAGTRIEQTERYSSQVQEIIRKQIPSGEIDTLLDNLGIPNSGINLSLSDGTVNSPADGEILVSLTEGHGNTDEYIQKIREEVAKDLPDIVVWAAPPDIATQVLNFGLPASIDVQISGPVKNVTQNLALAQLMMKDLTAVPGVVDERYQQVTATQDVRVAVDRTLANQIGVTQRDVASDLLISLSSSNQTAPNFWLNPANGVNYSIFVQTPQYRINSVGDLANTPIIPVTASGSTDTSTASQLLGNLASVGRGTSATNITHFNINPTVDILLGTRGTDLARVAAGVDDVLAKYRGKLPKGSEFTLRGQVESMRASFNGLAIGLVFAVMLVYLLIVINFQSWVDGLIILMALPGAAAGILWMLWATQTTISVPSLMGTIMSIGVATSNSILMITFANDQRTDEGVNAHDAALAAGMTRLRPVIMTAAAMIIGMLPMSLGLGEGGEQNAPLGRAVIGGLLFATMFTLIFVPVVYSLLRSGPLKTQVEKELR